ncbi:methyltransferase domain-containing protein [Nocardioides sp. BP30]|uniref:class I SAM-dependent methyltransferase n=1 Tax=Nocardioides sp. BP30 TaxID=3036374 RepID=UPI0024695729|nr:methyltransferase [Nocardioides sp. BP30]WGL53848.1 methyltransferase domain-containing protein [Nocardioides sp. BP30]
MSTPSERRSVAREAIVWEALQPHLQGAPLDVVDIGGGTGGFAVRVARLGHRVTVIDPSPDALAALDRRAREEGAEVVAQQGDLADLLGVVGAEGADLVLCHGVLEHVADVGEAMRSLHDVLRPGAVLSLMVAQRTAAVVARAMAGHFTQALAMLDDPAPTGRAGRRFTAGEATVAAVSADFEVLAVHGVRVFADLVPGSLLDLETGATASLIELERAVSQRAEFLPLASQLHLLAARA